MDTRPPSVPPAAAEAAMAARAAFSGRGRRTYADPMAPLFENAPRPSPAAPARAATIPLPGPDARQPAGDR
ncbi:hypothetical protein [Murinocardiopsis flavida]|nr:hypothetical protein [Murinocardiopsis flavida]